MKLKKEKINLEVRVQHYGFYNSDLDFAHKHKPYKDWLLKYTELKDIEDYECGQYDFDIEMIRRWIKKTKQPYEDVWSEYNDGIYILPKGWRERIGI